MNTPVPHLPTAGPRTGISHPSAPQSLRPHPPSVLLGPQPDGGKQIGAALDALGVRGPIALITAGWKEDESEDAALRHHLAQPAVNLRLHARSEALFAADPELADAHRARQTLLRQIQACYRIRLESADDAAKTIAVRHIDPALLADEFAVSIEVFRALDRQHAERCARVHAEFDARLLPMSSSHRHTGDTAPSASDSSRLPAQDTPHPSEESTHSFDLRLLPAQRPEALRHREELRAILDDSAAVVISGGNIGTLLSRLMLFDLRALLAERIDRPIVAWSAGAMALTERVICFHDFPPYGKDVAQVWDAGLGFAPGVVVLPDPRRRVRLDDALGIARFARRMSPARCFALDVGAELHFGRLVQASYAGLGPSEGHEDPSGRALYLAPSGEVDLEWRQ